MLLSPISVDNRQKSPSPQLWVKLLEGQKMPSKVAFLKLGDFSWTVTPEDGSEQINFTLEHKSIKDFIASVEDGRLSGFINAETPATKLLLLVWNGKNVTPRHGRPWGVGEIEWLLAQAQGRGVAVVRSPSTEVAAGVIANIARATASDEHRTYDKPYFPNLASQYTNNYERLAVRFLMGFPMWGEKRAQVAMRHYGTIHSVLQAVEHGDLAGIPGFGTGLNQKALEFLEDRG